MTDYSNRRFVIFDLSEIDKINFNDTYETSADLLRISTDGLKTFVEFNLPIPVFLENLETKSELLTYDEIINTLQNPPWISLDEEEITQDLNIENINTYE